MVNVTWEDKLEMYRLHREGVVLIADIATRFGIAVSTLYNYISEVNEKEAGNKPTPRTTDASTGMDSASVPASPTKENRDIE